MEKDTGISETPAKMDKKKKSSQKTQGPKRHLLVATKRKREASPAPPSATVIAPCDQAVVIKTEPVDTPDVEESAIISVQGDDQNVEIVTLHDDDTPSAVGSNECVSSSAPPSPKRARKTPKEMYDDCQNGASSGSRPVIACGTVADGQTHIVSSDGTREKVGGLTKSARKDSGIIRYYSCTDHNTYLSIFGASTVVAAPDAVAAKSALDRWLLCNDLMIQEQSPYRLNEILPRKRGVRLFNVPDHLRNSCSGDGTGERENGDIIMKFEDLRVFTYKDIDKCKPRVSGAIIFATSQEDALRLLVAELTRHGLIPYNKDVTTGDLVEFIPSQACKGGRVIPLSLYMISDGDI